MILDGVVKERAERLVLGRAMLERDAGDAEQMTDARDLRPLARLPSVQNTHASQRLRESSVRSAGCRVLVLPFARAPSAMFTEEASSIPST